MNILHPGAYQDLIVKLKEHIVQVRNNTLKTINTSLINLYYSIGEQLSQKIADADRGKSIVENVAQDIQHEFPGIKGFSKANIWNMIKFYDFYSQNPKLQPLAGEISWSNNIIILEKCTTDFQKEYYLKISKKLALSKRVLLNKIESQEFERLLSQNKSNNFELTLQEENLQLVQNTIKDEYIFDFLSLGEEYQERDLEAGLIKQLKDFILELGIGFAYIGNQYRLTLDGEEYFLDLLFYHTKLKCYIIIELKTGKFLPEYTGKLNFYINMVDDILKNDQDHPSIGILICKSKNNQTVDYALRGQSNPMAISEYRFEALPEDYQNNLPDATKIIEFLESI